MSPIARLSTGIVLGPLAVLLAMELLLQAGALVVQAGAREMPRNWLTGNTRILALGDSNTFGIYLEPDESYPARLQQRWNEAHPEHPIEVLNLGYPGLNSFRTLDNIDGMMERFRPDVVLLMIGINDFLTPVEQIAHEGDSAFAHLVRAVGRHSRLYHLIHMFRQSRRELEEVEIAEREIDWDDDPDERMARIMRFKRANSSGEGREVMGAGGEEFVVITKGEPVMSVSYLRENLGRIREIVDRYGADLYLLTYAASKHYYAKSNREIRLFAHESHARLIDVAERMMRFCPQSKACPELFFEDFHPKASGYDLVAGFVIERLSSEWHLSH